MRSSDWSSDVCSSDLAGGELVALPGIDYGGRRRRVSRLREALVLRTADAVTAASAPILDSLEKLGISAHRVPLGVDLRAWPPMPPRRRGAGPAKLIHVASLNRVKDQATLLRALSILARAGHEFTMDVVGGGTLHGEVHRLAKDLGLESHVCLRAVQHHISPRPR